MRFVFSLLIFLCSTVGFCQYYGAHDFVVVIQTTDIHTANCLINRDYLIKVATRNAEYFAKKERFTKVEKQAFMSQLDMITKEIQACRTNRFEKNRSMQINLNPPPGSINMFGQVVRYYGELIDNFLLKRLYHWE